MRRSEGSKRAEYEAWHQRVHEMELGQGIGLLAEWYINALELLPTIKGRRVLEVGCGLGQFATYLALQGAVVTAIDFSAEAIRIARARTAQQNAGVSYYVADAERLPFGDSNFDVVVSCECLEHVPNPQNMLSECARVLQVNGVLVLTTENYTNGMLLGWIVSWLRRKPFDSGAGVQPIEHFFVFWYVVRLLRKAGLTLRKMLGSHHVFLLLPRHDPSTFVVERFRSPLAAWFLRPLARHMAFEAVKKAKL